MNPKDILDSAVRVKKSTGKSIVSQLGEALRLRLSPSALSPSEYYEYHLFDDAIAFAHKQQFIGWRRSSELDRSLNADNWRAYANDKLLFHEFLHGRGFPLPRIRATYNTSRRHFDGAVCLVDQDSVGDYLRRKAIYPLFVKPIVGSFGRGAMELLRYRSDDDCVVLSNDETVAMQELLEGFDFGPFEGQLFQDVLQNDPLISERCGDRVCSVRVCVVLRSTGPAIVYTVWKISTGRNMTDNLAGGKVGNLTGWVDAATGTVERVARGMGTDYEEVTDHPDTGQRLLGFQLPGWSHAMDLCLSAATALPGLRLQNWDIVLSDSGPLLLEVNTETDFGPDQLYGRRGFLPQLKVASRDKVQTGTE